MKWIIISTLISLSLMFLFPDNQGVSDNDSNKIIASLQFNDVCNDAYSHGCNVTSFKSVYAQCILIYGNISLEECKAKCCDANQTSLNDLANSFGIQKPSP